MRAVCTAVTRSHLARARVLGESLRRHAPGVPLFALVVDACAGVPARPDDPFTCVAPEELGLGDWRWLRFHHPASSLVPALKPAVLAHLLERRGVSRALYLDSDLLLTGDLAPEFAALETASVLLSPHCVSPAQPPAGAREMSVLRSGVYNTGLVGVAGDAGGRAFLDFWWERCARACFDRQEQGYFNDQRWVDLAPGVCTGVAILRDPGSNVGWWNLAERRPENRDGLRVAGVPLRSFHFSGLPDAGDPRISVHGGERLDAAPALVPLFAGYREALRRAGDAECRALAYAFARFDNGVEISALAREYHRALSPAERERFGDPLEARRPDSFFAWLLAPAEGQASAPARLLRSRSAPRRVSNLMLFAHGRRERWRRRYPQPLGRDRTPFLRMLARDEALRRETYAGLG